MARAKKTATSVAVTPEEKYLKTFDSGLHIKYVVEGSGKFLKDGSVNLTIRMSHLDMDIPFCAQPHDIHEHGRWLFEQALKGTFGEISEYERPLPTVFDLQEELDKIWPDVVLGIATEEELSLAKDLRLQIKAMS